MELELTQRNILIILGVALAALVFYYWWSGSLEMFTAAQQLSDYYQPNMGIEDKKVDLMTCSPTCCGDQFPVPFEGLSAGEIYQTLSDSLHTGSGPYVRTNHTCSNGINGTGCPCINQSAYMYLANHGNNESTLDSVEPSFLIDTQLPAPVASLTPYQQMLSTKSAFANTVRINDLDVQRAPVSLANVQPQ